MKLATRSKVTRGGALGALGLAVVLAAPAFACSPQATLLASAARMSGEAVQASPGETIQVGGKSFDPGGLPAQVHLVDLDSGAERVLWSVQPDQAGAFAGPVTIPADTRLGDRYLLKATQTSFEYGDQVGRHGTLSRAFQVVAPGQASPPPGPGTVGDGAGTPPPPSPDPAPPTAGAGPQDGAAVAAPAAPAPASAAPAPTPAATERASAAPARGTAAPAPATAQAVPAPAAEAAAPAPLAVTEAVEAPSAAVAPEAPATVSRATATSDLWSGLADGSAAETTLDRPAPAVRSNGSFAAGLVLFLGGALALVAGLGVTTVRRARARARL